jgi:hypothetical protein
MSEQAKQTCLTPFLPGSEVEIVIPLPHPEPPEPISLETIVKKVSGMKKTLALWQRSRFRRKPRHTDIFRENRQFWGKRQIPSVVAQYLTAPQEGVLETINAGLTALGGIAIVLGILSFCRGWESDLSLGSLVSISGIAIIAIGLGGRFLASHPDF